jgi:two-component system chemotaxis response regulator CheB
MEVREARDGDEARPGLALVAPGNYHMLLRRAGGGFRVQVQDGPQVCYQRPSVDVLFASVAESAKERAVGALLTGMGSDGAQGLLRMKRAGARTIAQNEESCVVYGMPREAVKLGAADQVMALSAIPHALLQSCRA